MRAFLSVFVLGFAGVAGAQSYSADNLVVVQVGDGTVALSHRAQPVTLVERRPSDGGIVSALDITAQANGRWLTLSGIATSEGNLNLSTDGKYLLLAGYDAPVATNAVAFTLSTTTRRVIARVGQDRSINKATALTDAFSTGNVRCVGSVDGTGFWLAGTPGDGPAETGGIRWAGLGASTSTGVLSSPVDTRLALILQGQLHGSGVNSAFRVGTGLPISAGAVATGLPGISSAHSIGAIVLVAANRLYLADERTPSAGGGVYRYTLTSGTWVADYVMNAGLTTGIRRLAAKPNGSTFDLYGLTTQATQNQLVKVTDNGSLSGWATLAAASPNTAWRGLSVAPFANINSDLRVLPNDYSIVTGEELTGGLDSLWEIDGTYVDMFNDAFGLNAVLQVEGVAPNGTFAQLKLSVVSGVARNGLAVTFSLYNYTTNSFTVVGGQTASPELSQYQAAAPSPISRFIGPGRALRGRIQWAPINDEDPAQDGWLHTLDRVNWLLGS